MNTRALKIAAIAWALVLTPVAVRAADVTVLISNAFTSALDELAPRFEKMSGHKLRISYGSTGPLKSRIEKGEAFDLTLIGDAALDDLIKQGKLSAPTRAVIARAGLGVAIRKGAPKPDLATTDAFKRALIAAKFIAYNERGLSGIYLKGLFQRLEIAEILKAKTKDAAGGETVAKCDAEMGITQISEILSEAGAELAGSLPAEIQSYSVFVAAVSSGTSQADAAAALIKFLALPESASVMKTKGLESMPTSP